MEKSQCDGYKGVEIFMNEYKKLTQNTLILMIGTIGSRLISFVMIRFYTGILTTAEYGTIDLLMQISNFMVPICTIGVTTGIIRFGLDNRYRQRDVFSTSLLCFGAGFIVCLSVALVAGLFPLPDSIGLYLIWILFYVAASSLYSICGTFVRSLEKVRIYAIAGILNAACNVLLMILFLKFLQLGIQGYMLAVMLADTITALFLVFSNRLWRFIRFGGLYLSTFTEMIKFSIPTIPATISWWIIDMSDRLMISAMIGMAANGIYSVAAKIPSIVTIIANVFISAWQISIISTENKEQQTQFYSSVIRAYTAILYVMASAVTLFAHLMVTLLTTESYYEAEAYVPMLISATVFSCLGTFVGNIYIVEKKSVPQFVTTMIGAACNVILNWILIPIYGIFGAVIATFASFALLFTVRIIHTRKYMKLQWSPVRFVISFVFLAVQIVAAMSGGGVLYGVQILCGIGIVIVNFQPLMAGVRKINPFSKRS